MLRPLISIGCLAVAGTAAAEPVPLTSETIKETLSGSLLEMDTPLGTTIPVRFSKNGLVSGEAGILSGMLGANKDRGRWWTKNDELCVKWFRWFEAKQKCAALRQEGSRIYWRERGGESGTATLAERPQPEKAAPVTVAKADPKPEPQAQAQTEPAAPAQQIASADTGPLITQRSVTTKPLDDEDRPQLMFAGMTGLTDVAALVPPGTHAASQEEPPARTAALAQEPAPEFETQVNLAPETPSAAQPEITTAAAVPPPPPARNTERARSENIVDIDAMAEPQPVREILFRVSGVRADDVLNVRSGPSEYHEPVGRIPPAARGVKIVGRCRGEWCPIQRGRVRGWVNSYYLAEETSASRR